VCPTPLGRVHTRVAIIVGPALLGLVLSLLTGRPDWIVLIGVYLLLGVFLDTCVYSWLLKYQPPWMTGVLALVEFGLLYVLANVLKLDLSPIEAIALYWASWVLATVTRIVVLPNLSLTYIESAGEFRRIEWSLPPEQTPVPVLASVPDSGVREGALVDSASRGHRVPLDLQPSPSKSHDIPAGARRPERV
jgi:hypothetical protein